MFQCSRGTSIILSLLSYSLCSCSCSSASSNRYLGNPETLVLIRSSGHIVWEPGVVTETICKVDIRKYPFDTQKCLFIFHPWMTINRELTTTSPSKGVCHYLYFANMGSKWSQTIFYNFDRKISFLYNMVSLKTNLQHGKYYKYRREHVRVPIDARYSHSGSEGPIRVVRLSTVYALSNSYSKKMELLHMSCF